MSENQTDLPRHAAGNGGGGEVALAALGFCAALLVCFLLSAQLLQLLLGDRPRLVLIGAQLFGLLAPALVLTRLYARSGFPTRTSGRPPPSRGSLALALAGLAVSGYLVAAALNLAWLDLLNWTGWAWVGELESAVVASYRELLTAHSSPELLGVVLMVTVLPAVCEELAFRRGLQGLLASRMNGGSAVLLSAAIFSAFHLEPFGLPTRFFLGLSLGLVYHRTGSLWTAGLLHAAHNLAVVGGLQIAEQARGDGAPALSELAGVPLGPVAIVGAIGLVGWVISLQLLRPPGANTLDEDSA